MLHYLKDKTVLFLEDNEEFARNTTTLLLMFVQKIHHAATIEEAQRLFAKESVDFIITDIRLHQENGLDFVREVRSVNSAIPIIVLSGHKDEEFLFRSIPLGLTAYLLKPIKYEDLIDALSRCAEKLSADSQTLKELKEGWVYDSETKTLLKEGKSHHLNKKEALFMAMLSINRDRLITKEMFQMNVWQEDEMSDSAITNFIMRIRRRFGKDFIYTIPDLGYRFKL
jgi:DNA-binding response OmpR family regulator